MNIIEYTTVFFVAIVGAIVGSILYDTIGLIRIDKERMKARAALGEGK